ncbi:hypothetical protein CYMTET_26009 [Cymbomonas tetramitiformis]|uniref:Uncharacterized protein n=1 Tax=Cymbomonas tetramitiformis TaxID=36881 RepID=A0AAE0FU88_9CHLO|nr:hypothetical protein CYMTET_26009 [Cymbomonas tetramitiformis]
MRESVGRRRAQRRPVKREAKASQAAVSVQANTSLSTAVHFAQLLIAFVDWVTQLLIAFGHWVLRKICECASYCILLLAVALAPWRIRFILNIVVLLLQPKASRKPSISLLTSAGFQFCMSCLDLLVLIAATLTIFTPMAPNLFWLLFTRTPETTLLPRYEKTSATRVHLDDYQDYRDSRLRKALLSAFVVGVWTLITLLLAPVVAMIPTRGYLLFKGFVRIYAHHREYNRKYSFGDFLRNSHAAAYNATVYDMARWTMTCFLAGLVDLMFLMLAVATLFCPTGLVQCWTLCSHVRDHQMLYAVPISKSWYISYKWEKTTRDGNLSSQTWQYFTASLMQPRLLDYFGPYLKNAISLNFYLAFREAFLLPLLLLQVTLIMLSAVHALPFLRDVRQIWRTPSPTDRSLLEPWLLDSLWSVSDYPHLGYTYRLRQCALTHSFRALFDLILLPFMAVVLLTWYRSRPMRRAFLAAGCRVDGAGRRALCRAACLLSLDLMRLPVLLPVALTRYRLAPLLQAAATAGPQDQLGAAHPAPLSASLQFHAAALKNAVIVLHDCCLLPVPLLLLLLLTAYRARATFRRIRSQLRPAIPPAATQQIAPGVSSTPEGRCDSAFHSQADHPQEHPADDVPSPHDSHRDSDSEERAIDEAPLPREESTDPWRLVVWEEACTVVLDLPFIAMGLVVAGSLWRAGPLRRARARLPRATAHAATPPPCSF